jgi:FkbM family methyltransferase
MRQHHARSSHATSRIVRERLGSALARVRQRWEPPREKGARALARSAVARALGPYDRHNRTVLRDALRDVREATLAVADEVDALRSERDAEAELDAFVTADMSKLALEQHAKRSRFAAYLGDHLAVCRVLGDMKVFVDTRDHTLAPHLMTDGYWESWITVAMLRVLRPGMVAVDVGANYGYYSILMGRCVGREGRVFAFEANPDIARLLRKSLWISAIRNDEVHEAAAYSTTGEKVRFFRSHERPMNARVTEVKPYEGEMIDVPTVRLDDVLPERVDFIKIDAEGAEREIWRGLERTIVNNPQLQVFLEFNPKRTKYYDPHEFLARFVQDGFEIARVAYDGSTQAITAERLVENGSEQILHLRRATAPTA